MSVSWAGPESREKWDGNKRLETWCEQTVNSGSSRCQPQNFEVLALAILEVVEFFFVVYFGIKLSKFACRARVKCMRKQPEYGSFRLTQRSIKKKAPPIAQ